MAETRKVEQYKFYTLYANVVKVLGKKDGKDVTRTDRVVVAVFDDKALLDDYVKNATGKLQGQVGHEVGADWTEVKPEAKNFGVPFNPTPDMPANAVEKPSKRNKDNGTH